MRLAWASGRTIVFGRSKGADVQLLDNKVTQRHGAIHAAEHPIETGAWSCVDYGGTNGTLVNGERVGRVTLRDGDTIAIDSTLLCFFEGPDSKARAEAAALVVSRSESPDPDVPKSVGVLEGAMRVAVYEAAVHRRPLTLLTLARRLTDPIARLTDPIALFRLVQGVLPSAEVFLLGLRVAVLLRAGHDDALGVVELLCARVAESDSAVRRDKTESLHVGMASLERPAVESGPYDTREPVRRMIAASRDALHAALVSPDALIIAPAVVFRPA
jgi:pSer/pThr/pTyr-binding forkhead associated (FHA) protein